MIGLGHASCMGKKKNSTFEVLVREPEAKDYLEDISVDGRIILICILRDKMSAMDWNHMARNRDRVWILAPTNCQGIA
jgi:hypothetical protein